MKTNLVKLFAIVFFAVPVMLVSFSKATPVTGRSIADDPAAVYKAKCAMCHTPKAEKFFDPSKADADHVQVVMNGKKTEKPPFMPGFGAKGMTEDEAKALVAFMRSLRAPAN